MLFNTLKMVFLLPSLQAANSNPHPHAPAMHSPPSKRPSDCSTTKAERWRGGRGRHNNKDGQVAEVEPTSERGGGRSATRPKRKEPSMLARRSRKRVKLGEVMQMVQERGVSQSSMGGGRRGKRSGRSHPQEFAKKLAEGEAEDGEGGEVVEGGGLQETPTRSNETPPRSNQQLPKSIAGGGRQEWPEEGPKQSAN